VSALGTALRILRDPVVRGIVVPLAEAVVEWVRGGPRPDWLAGALREVPDLDGAVQALERAKERRARK
jgi:hypothetical protein